MNEDTSLNPICLLSRSDAATFSLYHSFFLAKNEVRGEKEKNKITDKTIENQISNSESYRPSEKEREEKSSESFYDLERDSVLVSDSERGNENGNGNGGAPIDCRILFRVPANRDRLDDIETAVKYFALNVTPLKKEGNDLFGTFVITTSDGSRFYAIWRGSPTLLLIAVRISLFFFPVNLVIGLNLPFNYFY
jgi:hypothetical protein